MAQNIYNAFILIKDQTIFFFNLPVPVFVEAFLIYTKYDTGTIDKVSRFRIQCISYYHDFLYYLYVNIEKRIRLQNVILNV
jgi:hypothetical protein